MKTILTRIAVLLPLLMLVAAAAEAKHKAKTSPTGSELAQVDFNHATAVLTTPERNVQVFRLTRQEDPKWTYMVVTADEDGTKVSYGDEHTVGALLEGLARDLHDSSNGGRCPAAAGWHFEGQFKTNAVHVSYCKEGVDTDRIERATQLLATTPSATD